MKRFFDVALSLCAIILLIPLFIVVSCLILITSGRPIFYVQKRVGMNRRRFKMYKFRTMVKNADALKDTLAEQNEEMFPFFKVKNDPRITKLGKILRKTSIDELPQLFNVLKGDMSIVGPRPLLPMESYYFEDERFDVLPGITGPTQIYRDKRMGVAERERIERDYILSKHQMLADMRIILKTVGVVFKGE